jgi:hypothetical protein
MMKYLPSSEASAVPAEAVATVKPEVPAEPAARGPLVTEVRVIWLPITAVL